MARKKETQKPASNDKFVQTARERMKFAREFYSSWQAQARDDFDFISGRQWLDDDASKLEQENRPAITFNYSEKMIDAVVGAEISGRQEVTYLPREVTDSGISDLWTNASKWVREQCGAEDEETDAFRDALICGLGWTETRMDYETDPEGMVVIDRRDPLEMYADPSARKPGLTDRRYCFHDSWVDKTEAAERWPGVMSMAQGDGGEEPGGSVINPRRRYGNDSDDEIDRHKDQVRITHYQCYEKKVMYRVPQIEGEGFQDLIESDFRKLESQLLELGMPSARIERRVYYRAFFVGETLLEKSESPCQEGFTFNCVTGKRDRNKNTWYGLTKVMKDPQRWANKWLSQILHIINSNAKGGLLAETGAFVDPKRAQDEWAKPDAVTLLNEGGLNRVKEKQMGQFPAGLDRLMEFALNSLPMVTGVNLEALGLANREQANVLEASRKQAAYGILAPFFDGLKTYRRIHGKVLLFFMKEFIADGRLIRISGDDYQTSVPLARPKDNITFDIIVDQSPNSPDSKQKTFETLTQIIPGMMKAGIPIPPDLLDYAPLPHTMVVKWKQFIEKQSQRTSPEQMQKLQEEMQKHQQQIQQLTQENQKLKTDQSAEMGKLQLLIKKTESELQLKRIELENEIAIEKAKLQLDAQKNNAEIQLKRETASNDIQLKRQTAATDLQLKNIGSGLDLSDEDCDVKLKMDTEELQEALAQIAQSQETMAQAIAQSQQQMSQAIGMLAQSMNVPKKVIFDENGRPVGIEPKNRMN